MAIVHVRRVTMVIGAKWSVFLDVMGTIVSRLVIVTTTSHVTRRMGGATSGVPRAGWETVVTKVRKQLLVVIVELKSFLLYEFYFLSYFTIIIDSSLFCIKFIFTVFLFLFCCTFGWCGVFLLVCPRGTFGFNCEEKCNCHNSNCHPETGECICKAGTRGRHCNKRE